MNNNNSHQKINLVSLKHLEQLLKIDRANLRQISNTAGRYYSPFDIHKNGNNKWRHIDNPQYPLKEIQSKILKSILIKGIIQLPEGMNGGITGKSIIDNASIHIGKECVGIIDIKDCFPNTSNLQIYQVWRNYFGCGNSTSRILTKLTTFQSRLPQGAPTSPLLCNYALASIFSTIKKSVSKRNLDISIFIDDITVSGKQEAVKKAVEDIVKVLLQNKYAVRKRKVKVITSGYSQKVTGITTNAKSSISRRKIQQIRNMIIETAKLKEYIPSDKYNKIRGYVSYAKSVSLSQGQKLEKFAESLLIKPVVQVVVKRSEQRRNCRRFRSDHIYHS